MADISAIIVRGLAGPAVALGEGRLEGRGRGTHRGPADVDGPLAGLRAIAARRMRSPSASSWKT